jgi:hypothetical protein
MNGIWSPAEDDGGATCQPGLQSRRTAIDSIAGW